MVLPRRLRFIALGALAGGAVAFWIWRSAQAALAEGQDPTTVEFGTSHGLVFVGLPWSLAIWGLGLVFQTATGADEAPFAWALLYAMPVVAGACWGWLASRPWRPRPDRRASRPAA